MRDQLAVFALRNAGVIAELYEARSTLLPIQVEGSSALIGDRLRDILFPMYAVAAAIDREAGQLIATSELDDFAAAQAGLRESDGGDQAVAVHALFNFAELRWDKQDKMLIKTKRTKC
jgi:hypothetical protein